MDRLDRITTRAESTPEEVFNNLFTLLTSELLWFAFRRLKRGKASGADHVSVEDYEENLHENLRDLESRLHRGTYKPQPSVRKDIPKGNGKTRPLGISAVEDKIVQRAVVMILEPVYEADFHEASYGFRPGRSCHQALATLGQIIATKKVNWVSDADIKGFFDNVSHESLVELLQVRISDPRLLTLITSFLKCGVLIGGQLSETEDGVPQGSCLSPLLAAWEALRVQIAKEQGFEAAAAMVLHTWNQKLGAHAHVHALVPGGGPSLDPSRPGWITSRRRRGKPSSAPYLVDAKELRGRYREIVLKGLRRLRRQGKLKLEGDWSPLQDQANWDEWLSGFENKTWVSFIQAPPNEDCRPEHVAKYLARYMTGGPISDRRLISHEDGKVSFWARVGNQSGGGDGRSAPYTVSGVEFVRLWSMHILPKGFTKSRRYGGYSNRHRDRYMKACAVWLDVQEESTPLADVQEQPEEAAEERIEACPECGEAMELVASRIKPAWSYVMSSKYRPWWYADG